MTWPTAIPRGVLVAAICVAIGLAIGWVAQGWRLGAELAEAKQQYSAYVAAAEEAAREAESQARKTEKHWQTKIEEVNRNAQIALDSVGIDAAVSAAALDRLRERYAQATARSTACGNTLTAQLSAATSAAGGMPPDVLARVGEAARLYAVVADNRGVAGMACEAAYQALKESPE